MSPWVFYVIDIVHSLRIVTVIISGISIFGWLVLFQTIADDRFASDDVRFITLTLFITSIIAAVLAIFLPSNETMVQMLVAATGTDIDHVRQIKEVTNAILLR